MTNLNLLISYFFPLKTTIRCTYIYILRVNTFVCDLEKIKIQGANLVLKPR